MSRIGRRFVPTSTITRRMDAQDERRARELRARTEPAIRIQIAVHDTLQAEAVVADFATANRLWAHYACARHRKGLESGGAVIQRADLPRTWDVPVGSEVTQ